MKKALTAIGVQILRITVLSSTRETTIIWAFPDGRKGTRTGASHQGRRSRAHHQQQQRTRLVDTFGESSEEPDHPMQEDTENDGDSKSTTDSDGHPWTAIGGGAVNEKKRNFGKASQDPDNVGVSAFDPIHSRSHLYHALEGLDRYPQYLGRWPETDMDKLEKALEKQLTLVQEQRKTIIEQRQTISDLVSTIRKDWKDLLEPPASWEELKRRKIISDDLWEAIFGSKMFRLHSRNDTEAGFGSIPNLQQVLSGEVAVELDSSELTTLMDEEFFDVFSLPVFTPDFCKLLREYSRALVSAARDNDITELTVGRRPINLDPSGIGWVSDLLFHLVLRPISRHLFSQTECGGGDLDWRHGFIAGYSASPSLGKVRERLVSHTDDSEVTLNVCLGDPDFEGGLLHFNGLRGTTEPHDEVFQPITGRALIHAGRHFHSVTQVTKGDRFALVLWARSWKAARSCACPCCWLNRRQDSSCICGPRWN